MQTRKTPKTSVLKPQDNMKNAFIRRDVISAKSKEKLRKKVFESYTKSKAKSNILSE